MSLGELFLEIGVFGDPEQVEKFAKKVKELEKEFDVTIKKANNAQKDVNKTQNSLKGLVKELLGTKLTLVAGLYAWKRFTNELITTNQAMLDLTRTSDIAQGVFQKWDNIGKAFGVQGAAQQIESLNERLFELRVTGQGARGFMLAGVNPMGGAEDVLEQLRDRVSGLSDTQASYLLRQMGIDPKMLHLLRMGREEFEALGQSIQQYQLLPEQTRAIQKMNIQLQVASIKLRYFKDRAILALMPAFTRLTESLARVVEGVGKFVSYITKLIQDSPILQSALKGIALAITAILAAANPLNALLAALYLLIDDIVGYFQGKNSGIGYIINFFDDYIKELENKLGELTLSKVIPEITLDVGKVIIKAGKITLENFGKTAVGSLFMDVPKPPTLSSPALVGLGLLSGYKTIENAIKNSENFATPDLRRSIMYDNRANNINQDFKMFNSITTSDPLGYVVRDLQNYALVRNGIMPRLGI